MVTRTVLGGLQQLDAFEQVLLLAGLDGAVEWPPPGAPLSPLPAGDAGRADPGAVDVRP